MKVASIVIKVVVALAAVAGVVYLAATYGDRVVVWAKKTLSRCKKDEVCFFNTEEEVCECAEACQCDEACEVAEPTAAEADFEA